MGSHPRVLMMGIVSGAVTIFVLTGTGPTGESTSRLTPQGNCTILESEILTNSSAALRTALQSQKKPSAPRRATNVASLHSESRAACDKMSEPQEATRSGWKPERAATYAELCTGPACTMS